MAKKKKRKKLGKVAERLEKALRWLMHKQGPKKDLVAKYARRFRVSKDDAFWELAKLGYYDEIQIERYEQDGIEWEYRVDPTCDFEMKVVPVGTPEQDLFRF